MLYPQLPDRSRVTSRRSPWWRAVAAVIAAACCVLAACTGNSGSGGKSASAPAFGATAAWNETWSKNPFNPNFFTQIAAQWAQLPMGYALQSKDRVLMFSIMPELMSSYTVDKNNLATVHIKPNLKFSDGSKLDATDVYDSMLLREVYQLGYDINIQSIKVANPTTIKIQYYKGSAAARGSIIAITPVPMSVYGKFVVPGLYQAWATYGKLYRSAGPDKAATSAAYKTIKSDYDKLTKFEPKKFVGDGPFTIQNVTTAQATLVKNNNFYAASKVGIPKVTLTNSTTTSNIFPLLFSHNLDLYAGAETSATILNRWKSTPDAQQVTVGWDRTEEIDFNNKQYPLTMSAARQALAHVIDRKKLVETEVGGTSVNKPTTYPDGLSSLLNQTWLSQSQLAGLDQYKLDTGKATQLLTAAGFKKTGGQWIMPNGKPWTADVIAPSTPSTAMLAAKEVAAELSGFGIKATASSVDPTGYIDRQAKGDFSLAYQTGVNGNLSPICGIASGGLGNPNNYSYTGDQSGDPGIGFGPKLTVPGIGKNINISQTIVQQCQYTKSGPVMAQQAAAWASLVNEQLPYLTYSDQYLLAEYSTEHYTKWPAADSKYWQEATINMNQALTWMIEDGYIQPK